MRVSPATFVFIAMLFWSAAESRAEDAPGCADFRQAPRAQGCRIVECGYKRHDSTSIVTGGDDSLSNIEGSILSINYNCPAGAAPVSIAKNLEALLKNSHFQILSRDFVDPLNPSFTARLNSQYVELDVSRDDDNTSYWLTVTNASPTKTVSETAAPAACRVNEVMPDMPGCVVSECNSKLSEVVQMQAAAEDVRALDGAVSKVSFECTGARGAVNYMQRTQAALDTTGYNLLYSEPDEGGAFNLTARKGKQWVEITSNHDEESNGFTVTRARVESEVPVSRPLVASLRPTVPLETVRPVTLPAARPVEHAEIELPKTKAEPEVKTPAVVGAPAEPVLMASSTGRTVPLRPSFRRLHRRRRSCRRQ